MNLNSLSKCTREDRQKRVLVDRALDDLMPKVVLRSLDYREKRADHIEREFEKMESISLSDASLFEDESKFCPECGRKYPESENFCFDCLVALKDIRDVDVNEIILNPTFDVEKANTYNDFEEIFTKENIELINDFDFAISDFNEIIDRIKLEAFKRLDTAIKDNGIHMDSLSILEKIVLFAKSFVNISYKSYGQELGYYEFDEIHVDDRQLDALQITTILHELAHFLMKEITAHILCEILDCSKTSQIEAISVFILSYSPLNQLIDEYAAHTVEGRFSLFGYQDYSSFLSIQKTLKNPTEEIEMLKTIGNSFANAIKGILEAFINHDLLNEIKKQFRTDIMDRPDYRNLAHENCTLLNGRGMVQAIRLIVADGFMIAMDNTETLKNYTENLETNNEH